MQNENKGMLRKRKVGIFIPVLSFGLLLSTLAFNSQAVVGGSHAASASIKHHGAISSASHQNHSRISASGLVVADATQVAVALPTTTPTTLIAAATPATDVSSAATATTANNPVSATDTPAATATTSGSGTTASAPAATVTTASTTPATVTTASTTPATVTTADTTPAATETTASTTPATVTTADTTPAATVTTASTTPAATETTANTTPAATVTTASTTPAATVTTASTMPAATVTTASAPAATATTAETTPAATEKTSDSETTASHHRSARKKSQQDTETTAETAPEATETAEETIPEATETTAITLPITVSTVTTSSSSVTTESTPVATVTTASSTATTAETTPEATETPESETGNPEDTSPKTVTVWVQTLDSCRQAIGGAFYALSLPDGPVLQVVGPVPGTSPVTVSTTGECPIPRGNCLTIMTGCISFALPVPVSGQSNFTITETQAPKGFVACLKATKCIAPAKVDVTVFPNGTVSATTTIVFGNGRTVIFPRTQTLPTSMDTGTTGSNPSNPTTIVVEDGKVVQPASATTLRKADDTPGATFTMTQSDPALVYNNQICSEKNNKHCEGKGMVVRATTKVAVVATPSHPANVKRASKPVKPAR